MNVLLLVCGLIKLILCMGKGLLHGIYECSCFIIRFASTMKNIKNQKEANAFLCDCLVSLFLSQLRTTDEVSSHRSVGWYRTCLAVIHAGDSDPYVSNDASFQC